MVRMAMGVGIILRPLHGMYHDNSSIIYLVDRNANSITVNGDGAATWSIIVNAEVSRVRFTILTQDTGSNDALGIASRIWRI